MVTNHPKSHWRTANMCFLLLLCVHHGLAGDADLHQPPSGIQADGAPTWHSAAYRGRGDKKGLAKCATWNVTSYFHSHFLGQTKPYSHAQVHLGEEVRFYQVVRRGGRPDIREQAKLCYIHFPIKETMSSSKSLTGWRGSEWKFGSLCYFWGVCAKTKE